MAKTIKSSKYLSDEAEKELFRLTATIMPALAPMICNPQISDKQLDKAINRAANCYWKLMGRIKEQYNLTPPTEK